MYPRKIKVENNKLKKLIEEKGVLINTGRGISNEIEIAEKEKNDIEKKIIEIEKGVDVDAFQNEAKEVSKRMEVCISDLKEIKKKIYSKIKDAIPKELSDKYDDIKNDIEKKENSRNRIAIKAQKYNDIIIPLGRKLMSKYIEDEFEDFDTLKIEDGVVVATIFSHLNDFKINFKKKKNGIL